jgi:hypothetical protein
MMMKVDRVPVARWGELQRVAVYVSLADELAADAQRIIAELQRGIERARALRQWAALLRQKRRRRGGRQDVAETSEGQDSPEEEPGPPVSDREKKR